MRPSDEFYDCRHKWCRPCVRQNSKDWKQRHRAGKMAEPPARQDTPEELSEELDALAYHPEESAELPMEMRHCPQCGEMCASDDFYETRKWCKPCVRQRTQENKRAHRTPPFSHDAPQTLEGEMDALAYTPEESSEPPNKRQKVEGDSLYLTHNPRIPGEVKIGRARNVEARLKDLSACQNFSLVLVKAWPGMGHLERHVHHQLAARRLTEHPGREWFRLDLAEADLIDQAVRGLELVRDAWERLEAGTGNVGGGVHD